MPGAKKIPIQSEVLDHLCRQATVIPPFAMMCLAAPKGLRLGSFQTFLKDRGGHAEPPTGPPSYSGVKKERQDFPVFNPAEIRFRRITWGV